MVHPAVDTTFINNENNERSNTEDTEACALTLISKLHGLALKSGDRAGLEHLESSGSAAHPAGLHSSIWSEKHLQLQGTPIRGPQHPSDKTIGL